MADEPDDATIRRWADALLHSESAAFEKAKAEINYWQLKAQFEATKAREAIEVQKQAGEAEAKAAEASIIGAEAAEREKRQVLALVRVRCFSVGHRLSRLGTLFVLERGASEVTRGLSPTFPHLRTGKLSDLPRKAEG